MSPDGGLWDLVNHDTGRVLEGPLTSAVAGKRRRELERLYEDNGAIVDIWIEPHQRDLDS